MATGKLLWPLSVKHEFVKQRGSIFVKSPGAFVGGGLPLPGGFSGGGLPDGGLPGGGMPGGESSAESIKTENNKT